MIRSSTGLRCGVNTPIVVAALALKADVKVEAIEPLLEPDLVYGLIVACKAARLTWSTTTMIVRNRPNCPPSTDRELEQCVAVFESLLLSVAQWTIRFGSDRILAKKNEPAAAAPAAAWQTEPVRLTVALPSARNPPAS